MFHRHPKNPNIFCHCPGTFHYPRNAACLYIFPHAPPVHPGSRTFVKSF